MNGDEYIYRAQGSDRGCMALLLPYFVKDGNSLIAGVTDSFWDCTSAPPAHWVKAYANGFFVISFLGQLFGWAFRPFF